MEQYNMIKNFTCEICEKAFQTNKNKKRHIRTAHGEAKNLICNVCNRIFETKNGLNSHLHLHHLEGKKKFVCDSSLNQDL